MTSATIGPTHGRQPARSSEYPVDKGTRRGQQANVVQQPGTQFTRIRVTLSDFQDALSISDREGLEPDWNATVPGSNAVAARGNIAICRAISTRI